MVLMKLWRSSFPKVVLSLGVVSEAEYAIAREGLLPLQPAMDLQSSQGLSFGLLAAFPGDGRA